MMQALGWTLIHFLWEGSLVALLLAGMNLLMRRASARARYLAACSSMALMVAVAVVTLLTLARPSIQHGAIAGVADLGRAGYLAGAGGNLAFTMPGPSMPLPSFVVTAWAVGVLLLSIRTIGGFLLTQRLKLHAVAIKSIEWQRRVGSLAMQLGVKQFVQCCELARVKVTMTVGWLRPVILLPMGALLQFPPEQVEALLAHELAHIRRLDYLVNILQTAVETLFFYHPAVWWVSRRIRQEQENCCDDLAVAVLGDPIAYAKALTDLEEFADRASQFAVAASGASLLVRVKRLISAERKPGRAWVGAVLAVTAILAGWASTRAIVRAAPQNAVATRVAEVANSGAAPPQDASSLASSESATPQRGLRAESHATPSASAEPGGSYISALAAQGYANLSVDELIAFKTMGVSPEYIRELHRDGLHPSVNQVIAMRTMSVTPDYVNELKQAGYSNISTDQLIACRTQGVSPDAVRKLNSLGFGKLTIQQLISARTFGLGADFASAMRDAFPTLTFNEIIAARTQGLTPEYVGFLRSAGMPNITFNQALSAHVMGVTPAFVREVHQHGFNDLSVDNLIELRTLGIFSAQAPRGQ
jgi:beta-lactamase regulating signal transducer with metallopeptidase domain